ncbi:hypothetical protein CHH64_12745 [Terribacillus saccharophilus]|uniref:Uncharacterized protein n=1 Tax=Terribacillus saccharophilus TaxID=361277 RepID=A0A268A9G7_9BACI|nr:hypothetical protein CHH64_12745 [Terribacillus saccharophilus]
MYPEYLLVRQKVVYDFIVHEEGYDLERAEGIADFCGLQSKKEKCLRVCIWIMLQSYLANTRL